MKEIKPIIKCYLVVGLIVFIIWAFVFVRDILTTATTAGLPRLGYPDGSDVGVIYTPEQFYVPENSDGTPRYIRDGEG